MAELIETIGDLKADLERLERKVDHLFRMFDVTYIESDLPNYMLEATQFVRHGRRDAAVKVIREYTAVGIVEARAQVEQIERNLGVTGPVIPHLIVEPEPVPGLFADEGLVHLPVWEVLSTPEDAEAAGTVESVAVESIADDSGELVAAFEGLDG